MVYNEKDRMKCSTSKVNAGKNEITADCNEHRNKIRPFQLWIFEQKIFDTYVYLQITINDDDRFYSTHKTLFSIVHKPNWYICMPK